jgi:hypothetical protein
LQQQPGFVVSARSEKFIPPLKNKEVFDRVYFSGPGSTCGSVLKGQKPKLNWSGSKK